jgi:outer membrane protein assembly factor BamB
MRKRQPQMSFAEYVIDSSVIGLRRAHRRRSVNTSVNARIRLPRLLVTLLVLTGLIAPILQSGVAAQGDEVTLDLPAMTLTPADVDEAGLPGFGLAFVTQHTTGWRSLGDAAHDSPTQFADGLGELTLDQLHYSLAQTGWLRQYRRILARPDSHDPDLVETSIFSEVAEFADAEGADTALTLFTSGGEAEASPDDVVGDRMEIRRDVLFKVGSRLSIAFREGRLLGIVHVTRYATEEGAALGPALLLAHRFQERIAAGVAHPGPGLSNVLLRLATVASPPDEEHYLRLDGETFPYFGESDDSVASAAPAFRDSIDVYERVQLIEQSPGSTMATVYVNRLFRFPDEDAADAWLDALPQGLADDAANSDGTFQVGQLDGTARIGDESLTFAVTLHPEGGPLNSYRIYARVGVYGVRLQFGGADEPPLAVVENLAAAQAECIRAGSCPEEVQLPRDLAGLSCPPVAHSDGRPDVGAALAPGEVPMIGADPAHTGVHPGPGPAGAPEERWRFATTGAGERGPIAANGLLYFTSRTNRDGPIDNLYAVDAATGASRWCVTTGRQVTDPVYADGLVYTFGEAIPSDHFQPFVVALSATTGIERWRFYIDQIIDSSRGLGGLTVADGSVYVGTGMGALFALDAATGEPRWFSRVNGDGKVLDQIAAPAVAGGVLYVAENQFLFAFDAETGEELWRFRPETDSERLSRPTIAGGTVYVAGLKHLYAVDGATGQETWRFAAKGSLGEGLAVSGGLVYAGTGSIEEPEGTEYLYAIDAESGRQRWRFKTAGYVTTPVIAGDVVYVSTGVEGPDEQPEGAVLALSAPDGEELWSYSVDGMPTSPVVLGGRVYVSTRTARAEDEDQIVYAIGGTATADELAR